MTGETQLRAKRTRIKILRAIADRNGAAGFSDIKDSTGLSTGSIYYHLERMGDYIVKDSKQYTITEQGVNLLREIGGRPEEYGNIVVAEKSGKETRTTTSDSPTSPTSGEDTIRNVRLSNRNYKQIFAIGALAGIATLALAISWSNPSLFSAWMQAGSGLIIFALVASFLSLPVISIASKRSFFGMDGKLMLSVASVVSVLFVSAMFFSGNVGGTAAATRYDNTLDALLSSYSFQWGLM